MSNIQNNLLKINQTEKKSFYSSMCKNNNNNFYFICFRYSYIY